MRDFALLLPVYDHAVEYLEHMKEMAVDDWYEQVAHTEATPLGAPVLDVIDNPTYLWNLDSGKQDAEPFIDRVKLIIRVTGSTR